MTHWDIKALQCVYKSWPFDDLDIFYDEVNLGPHALEWRKLFKCHLNGNNLQEMGKWAEDL